MNEDELLNKYRNYVKKRNLVIIISLLFLSLFIIISFSYLSRKNDTPNNTEQKDIAPESKEEIKDEIAPILELTTEKITIEVNSNIDYNMYIKEATDNIDGDIIKDVQFSKIDTSKIGEYEVVYYVFDTSNNVSQKILNVSIVEQSKEEVSEENNSDIPSTQKPSNNDKKDKNENNIAKPSIKYFLFTDGYTMSNVVDACATELKKYNGSGMCSPITDENGIYLGMKLELN